MVSRRQNKAEDDGPDQQWIVTFSDCMTLLLTFFVLLLSFSSFSQDILQTLTGAMSEGLHRWTPLYQLHTTDSVIDSPRPQRVALDAGSERRTDSRAQEQTHPQRPPDAPEAGAFAEKRVFFLPSDQIFLGDSAAWRPGAKDRLLPMVEFIRGVRCHVVLGESRSSLPGPSSPHSMQRAMALLEYFTVEAGLPVDWFTLAAGDPGEAHRTGGRAVMRLALLDRRIGQ